MIKSVLKNFGSLTSIRILSRVFEFFLKAYLIKNFLSQDLLAHMIHLQLVLSVSLHVVKSSIKPSYQKIQEKENGFKSALNIGDFGIAITVVSAIIICQIQRRVFSEAPLPYFKEAISVYGLAAVFEAVYQKFNSFNVLNYSYLKIGIIEMASFLPKTLFILISSQTNLLSTYGILIFAFSQLIYASLLMLISFVLSPNKQIYPHSYESSKKQLIYIDPLTKASVKQFSILTFLKLFMSQFQKILLVVTDQSKISSIFSLVSGLGSIVVRYFFAPLQEIIYNYFSRGDERESINAMIGFVRGIAIFSVLSLSFGYNYSESFLLLLYGERWCDQDSIYALETYTILLSVMGLNGVIQAFTFAKGRQSLAKYKYFSILTTLLHWMLSYTLLHNGYGAAGLFLGTTANMLMRVCLCWNLEIKKHIKLTQFLKEISPSKLFFAFSVVIFIVCLKSLKIVHREGMSNFVVFLIGGIMFGINILPILYEQRKEIKTKIREFFSKNKSD